MSVKVSTDDIQEKELEEEGKDVVRAGVVRTEGVKVRMKFRNIDSERNGLKIGDLWRKKK